MTDAELNRMLKSARVPERTAQYWQEFPHRIVNRLGHGGSCAPCEPATRRATFAWGVGLATACVVLASALYPWRAAPASAETLSLAQGRTLLRELSILFPNSVRAIVVAPEGVRLALSDPGGVPGERPVFIRLWRDGRSETVITFSGQTVEVAGAKFEVLGDSEDHLYLVGENALWSSIDPGRRFARLRVEATHLEKAL